MISIVSAAITMSMMVVLPAELEFAEPDANATAITAIAAYGLGRDPR